ncbi:MAG: hypothetical protein ACXVEF_19530 [Polyangiales bacterium]
MAGHPSLQKREKERARKERAEEKAAKRKEKKDRPASTGAPGEDPDIAGIVPGPQPMSDDH